LDQTIQTKGKEMRKYFLLGTILLLMLSISACSTTGSRFAATRQLSIHQAAYNDSTKLDFFQYKEGWLDPQTVILAEANRMSQQSGGMPVETVRAIMPDMPRYKIFFYLAKQNVVVYRIGIDMPSDLLLKFSSRGSLTFNLASGKEVPDLGIIVPQDFSPISDWHDSRRQVAVLSKNSNNGKPAGMPNVIFVLMPKSVYGQRVVKVTPNKSMSFSGQASFALK